MTTMTTTRVSSTGAAPAISGDGRYVAFETFTLFEPDSVVESGWDTFVHDSATGSTTLVAVPAYDIGLSNDDTTDPAISTDGTIIAFSGWADNLVAGDSNGVMDIFVRGL